MLFVILLHNIVNSKSEQMHIFEEFLQRVVSEFFSSLCHDAVTCSGSHIVAHSASLVYDSVVGELFVSFCCCVDVHLYLCAVCSDAWYAIVAAVCSCENLVSYAFAYLQIYRQFVTECSHVYQFVLGSERKRRSVFWVSMLWQIVYCDAVPPLASPCLVFS